MAAATGRVDELVKDYLLYRGCTASLRNFEYELKVDKDKGLRADKILEQFQHYMATFNLSGLRDYWNHLNTRLFCRLEQRYVPSVRKLEVGLLKMYVVNASQSNRSDKVTDFFEKMTGDLQQQTEFKEWFCFPFIKNPEENSHFSIYFTKTWQDMFYLSLFNFLSVIINVMPAPILLNFDIEHRRMKNLQEENEMLKTKFLSKDDTMVLKPRKTKETTHLRRGADSSELHYDFNDLEDDTFEVQKQQKPGRKFPFSAPPLLNRKPNFLSSNKSPTKSQGKAKVGKSQALIIQKENIGSGVQSGQGHPEFTSRSLSAGAAVNKSSHLENTSRSQGKLNNLNSTSDTLRNRAVPSQGKPSSLPKSDDLLAAAASRDVNVARHENLEQKSSDVSVNLDVSPKEVNANQKSNNERPNEMQEDLTPVNENNHFSEASNTKSIIDKSDYIAEDQGPFLLLSQEDYKEHRSAISYARFSVMGQYVASVDVDGIVKIWSWSPQPVTCATVMSKSAFLSLEWASKQDRWLLLGNRSGNIRLFDVKEMKSFYEATTDSSYPRIVSLSSTPTNDAFICSATINRARSASGSDIVTSASARYGKLSLWDLRSMKQIKHLELQPGPMTINCCSFNHNGHLLLTGGADGNIRLFDMQQHKVISQWEAHSGEIQTLQFSSDETSCYSIGTDGKVRGKIRN